LAPFLFGAVERRIWMPLCLGWVGLGLLAAYVSASPENAADSHHRVARGVTRALLPLHALFALQLLPLPEAALRHLSPGAHAAHFLPDPLDGRFRPLSVSPGATIEAWFYVAALQGLFLAVQGLRRPHRRTGLLVLATSAAALSAEGLWQSRSEHPYFLYGRIPTYSPQGLETSTYGPYYNRNHFATVTAMGAGLSAGMAARIGLAAGGLRGLLTSRSGLPATVTLVGLAGFLSLASAASGSRSGALAALVGLAVVGLRAFGRGGFVAVLLLGGTLGLIAGPASVERLAHLDLEASRWRPWLDMTVLFRFFWAFGTGIGAFGAAYWPYQRNATYEFWQHAHNEYLEWLLEGGILGVLVLIAVLAFLRRYLRLEDECREALAGAISVVLVQSLLDFPLRIPANAAFLVCALALSVGPRETRQRGV